MARQDFLDSTERPGVNLLTWQIVTGGTSEAAA